MNDITPPEPKPEQQYSQPVAGNSSQPSESIDQVVAALPSPMVTSESSKPRRRWPWLVACGVILLALLVGGAMLWYLQAAQPVNPSDDSKQVLKVEPGATPAQIAAELDEREIIRSHTAFIIYAKLNGVHDKLQSGSYRLSPSESLSDIITHLSSGKTDEINITFYPGATLYDNRDNVDDKKRTDVYTMLRRVGFSDQQVRRGLEKNYDHPLLADKPSDASLEGYVYGDTYRFDAGASVETILKHTFDIFYERITDRGLVDKFKQQGMTLYQGITLSSIIEREVSGRDQDQKQVSQVFHLRLEKGMPLGADATFQYAAIQDNVAPSSTLDSPYNTRIHTGLPPGPISSPHISALEAAASPAKGDYLYFVSGDDGTTHFARTDEEHQANTRKYCTTLCLQP